MSIMTVSFPRKGDYYLDGREVFLIHSLFRDRRSGKNIWADHPSKFTSFTFCYALYGIIAMNQNEKTQYFCNYATERFLEKGGGSFLFDAHSAKAIAEVFLQYFPNLESIFIGDGSVTNEGATAFRQIIPSMPKLKHFSIPGGTKNIKTNLMNPF